MISYDNQVKTEWDASNGAGKLLRAAREARGISTQQVAGSLRLDVKHIEAMERDEFTNFVAPVFVRGYLRSYARFLDLSPDSIVKSYDYQSGPVPLVLHGRSVLSEEASNTGDRAISWVIYLIVLASLILGVVWWQTQGTFRFAQDEPPLSAGVDAELSMDLSEQELVMAVSGTSASPITTESAAPPVLAQETPDPAMMQATSEPPATALQAEAGNPATASALNGTPSATASLAPPAGIAQSPNAQGAPAVSAEPSQPVAAAPTVVLNLTAESWVDITDSGGNRLVYKLLPAGANKTLHDLKLPLKVVLGNGAGVNLEYNNQPFDHSRFISKGVTRFQLGSTNLSAVQ